MIELERLSKRYGLRAAVLDLTLSVGDGEFLALVGQSGSGKTTTLNMINRLVEPSTGGLRISGEDALAGDPVRLRRRMGYVFQGVGLFPHLTVWENIAITPRLLGWPDDRTAARVEELLAVMRLEPSRYRERMPRELSGGQQQRVGLARALAAKPRIMLMDEPFGALDAVTRDGISADYRAIHGALGLTTLLVTHDITEALLLADRIALMRDGRLVQLATPAELSAHPADDFVRALVEAPRLRAKRLSQAMAS